MGNMIPPSNNILVSHTEYLALITAGALAMPEIGVTEFWLVMWGISIWFVLHRLLMVFIFCKVYKIKAMPKEQLPDLKTSLKEHWQGLLLPVIIMAPFVLDFLFKDNFFTQRLGAAGAKNFATAALLFIPGVATIYGFFITKDKSLLKPQVIIGEFGSAIKTIAPTVGVCLFGYMIGALFDTMSFQDQMKAIIEGIHIPKLLMVILICVFTTIMGMIIPGSAIIKMFGGVCITALAAVKVNPLLAAAMLPVICGVMCGITPPLGLGLYAGMSIAGSDFDKTVKNNWWWVFTQFAMQVIILMGLLPILGV
jgi:TRAP-type C4-dicarboxylate transport system permease large subunit